MKRNYFKPATEIAETVIASQALASSGAGAPARATSATRSDYGEGTNAW